MNLAGIFSWNEQTKAVFSDIRKYIGPGLLVTVGFIDPGNWAANVAAGSIYGYKLLWMVTLSTIMLILLQHNAAHLGIVTGECLSEAATRHLPTFISRPVLASACLAACATAMAELLGGAIALQMLFGIPLKIGTVMLLALVIWFILGTAYRRAERFIIGFVSLIGLSFIFELWLVPTDWRAAASGWVIPAFPAGSLPVIMSVLGAVVMPHNLFLHSEIIQSRQWNLESEETIRYQLKFEFLDTLISMGIGWAINSAMILMAAATFYVNKLQVTELAQAKEMLQPMLGSSAAMVFAIALLLAGIASSITAGMAGGSIFAGIFGEPFNSSDVHTRNGILLTMLLGTAAIFFVEDTFKGLIYSQVLLSIQLPWTIFMQIYLTSSKKVMGSHANTIFGAILLWGVAVIVTFLNVMLLLDFLK
ncbi:MAG: Nramp family divalent metal transporter [Geobacteraceae bacterium]|nr:Nramp family divalent metal transporter [Geobacteraceae bacterium]